ncbi:transglycosylase domain-containing protein [Staphylococcus argenteus]|uniref:transglycosylase domain-containing protein n=1 Tax=Staphylococcus argenteus TaxID=985002 RepID=UPI00050703D4|nr:transglycosylase domain-containing protein [Staphylococcus argenteus]API79699.1 transglycosylase [Staphylococcus argenteus]MBE2123841.1 penicillin-binding protein [Staphylococcus argenteus]MBE2140487.1 penicillin-binding protein [Staphylococcus argenteus]MCG6476143.1 penicillin-binding protein [Staphylococcus argenteus]MDH9620319.1 transglycosylase domain-containing protein [Staphylococcus argenteus]
MTNQDNNHQMNHRMYQFEKIYKTIKHIIVIIFMIIIAILAVAVIAMSFYFHHLTKMSDSISDEDLIKKVRKIPGDELLDHTNKNLLSEYNHSQNSLIIGPKTSSPNVIKALTSSEDTLFYKHDGILPKAIIRAMIQDIFKTDQSSGGSTITQQLIKNQVLSNEKTYSRKANELRLSIRLEHLLSKDEIIYTYLNIVPFGRDYNGANITGIASASYSLFGIPPKDLSIAQSAYLIGLLQSPYSYTPYEKDGTLKSDEDLKYSIQRQLYVLKRMLIEDQISKKEYDDALKYDIKSHLLSRKKR